MVSPDIYNYPFRIGKGFTSSLNKMVCMYVSMKDKLVMGFDLPDIKPETMAEIKRIRRENHKPST